MDRKPRLIPWIAEFEAILAFIRKGLPFFVSLPTDDGIVYVVASESLGLR